MIEVLAGIAIFVIGWLAGSFMMFTHLKKLNSDLKVKPRQP